VPAENCARRASHSVLFNIIRSAFVANKRDREHSCMGEVRNAKFEKENKKNWETYG
jgi:hypothetical protein